MDIATKLIRADASRPTRFHTERRTLMPLSAWIRAPIAISKRLREGAPREPWLVPSAVSFLASRIEPEWRVLEVGAGASTVWWAARCSYVVSLEDDQYWLEAVRQSLHKTRQTNVALISAPQVEFRAIVLAQEAQYDVAVVDSNEAIRGERVALVEAAAPLIRPGGYLVLDDSDRPEYEPLNACLNGWKAWRFVGLKPRPLMACETTVFLAP